MVVHTSNPSYLGGWIQKEQEFETSQGKVSEIPPSKKKQKAV
jgi:hypothetical protein